MLTSSSMVWLRNTELNSWDVKKNIVTRKGSKKRIPIRQASTDTLTNNIILHIQGPFIRSARLSRKNLKCFFKKTHHYLRGQQSTCQPHSGGYWILRCRVFELGLEDNGTGVDDIEMSEYPVIWIIIRVCDSG